MTNELLKLSDIKLMDRLGDPGSRDTTRVLAELKRRQTEAQSSSARWMKWSVVILTIATIANIVIQAGRYDISVAGVEPGKTTIVRVDRYTGTVETCVAAYAWAGNEGGDRTQPKWCEARLVSKR